MRTKATGRPPPGHRSLLERVRAGAGRRRCTSRELLTDLVVAIARAGVVLCDQRVLTVWAAPAMEGVLQQIDNFYVDDDRYENTPSRRVGVDAETEKRLRVYGCDRIQRAVMLLGKSQVVAATAQILFHRFYFQKDVKAWHVRVRPAISVYKRSCMQVDTDVAPIRIPAVLRCKPSGSACRAVCVIDFLSICRKCPWQSPGSLPKLRSSMKAFTCATSSWFSTFYSNAKRRRSPER